MQTFGSLIETAREVEKISSQRLKERLDMPCLGGRPLVQVPQGAHEVTANVSGYVQFIYAGQLQKAAEAADVNVYVTVSVGSFVIAGEVIAYVSSPLEKAELLSDEIVLGDLRSFDQNPRFGPIVLGELASKALSPGNNDAGTAIDVMTRLTKVLSDYKDEADCGLEAQFNRVYILPIGAPELINSGFAALAAMGRSSLKCKSSCKKRCKACAVMLIRACGMRRLNLRNVHCAAHSKPCRLKATATGFWRRLQKTFIKADTKMSL